ncbi:hypothetical protein [Ruegeria lacuscaerulensis]|uniref:hypothetical protein n=1 Tax=Ruegeria lacuscaerulensis TaxID=55218 RepID=UPI0014811F7C|nr:hypothetical protein [Ruegeria lacuscaerulensis]
MVQNNKVLTVSYGTFSCTLEGFDDSFETMKAIAEYFRDLAAEDRYFGSEPPQPDAEMLARIAQRDVARRVEASQNDSGLLLRATEQPAPAPIATAPTPTADPEPVPSQPDPVATEADEVEDAPTPAADSIAAKLQRIRAVVSHSEENTVIYSEDEETTLMKAAAGPSDAVAAAFEAGSLSAEDLGEASDTEPQESPEEAVAAIEEALAEDEIVEDAPEETEQVFDDTLSTEFGEPAEEVQAAPTEVSDGEPEEEIQPAAMVEEAEEAAQEDLTPEADAMEENDPVNLLQEDEEAMDMPEDDTTQEEGVLTADDEEDLLSEISNVEAFLARRAADSASDTGSLDQDVSRLMDKADVQMEDPATTDQRETYSHLRAAVAATEAERKDKPKAEETSDHSVYRDLTASVSPRRPDIQVTGTRPQSDKMAPLKLVAEQRIDADAPEAAPVTPRRVSSSEDAQAGEEGGFALFAQEQGAQSLPDLLEAAASYLSFIEGQEQFSRPQLMNKIRSLQQADFNREESLRSFGQLLRDGKIEKAGGGRFAASTDIGFRPDDDERAAG